MKELLKEYIETANRPMQFGRLPVSPKEAEVPVLVSNKWETIGSALVKTFEFRRQEDREIFVNELFAYEREVQHNAKITIDHSSVSVEISTKDIGKITEIDKEYAKYCDILFKDIVYCS